MTLVSPEACRTAEMDSVASPSAARWYARLSGTKNDVWKFGVRMPRGAFAARRSSIPETSGLPSNHTVPTYSVRRASPPCGSRTNVSMRGCGSTSIIVIDELWSLGRDSHQLTLDVALQVRRNGRHEFVVAHRCDRLDLPDVAHHRQTHDL